MSARDTALIQLLLSRLERVSVDSYWAHRASGVRGALLHVLEQVESEQTIDNVRLQELLESGFHILERAAGEKGRLLFP